MTDVYAPGRAYARALITAGKVDKTAAWSWDAADQNALLGASGSDWTTYAKAHLGEDKSQTDKTRDRWKYPFAKNGKIYRSALVAIRQRSAQQNDTGVYAAAGALIDQIDGKGKSSAAAMVEAKSFAAFEFKFTGQDEGGSDAPGSFEGYASTFNTEDDGGDLILPGAFDATLAQSKATGRMPKMLLNHGGMGGWNSNPSPMDMVPIGKWTEMTPDDHGLAVKGRLINLDTEQGKSIYGAMKEGELSDLSIGYVARDYTRGRAENEPRRTIKAMDLHEVSPVTFPMNRLATVDAVKQALAGVDLFNPREAESALRDEGFSCEAAVKAVAVFRKFVRRDGGLFTPEQPRDEAESADLTAVKAELRAALGLF